VTTGVLAAAVQFLVRWPFLVPYLARADADADASPARSRGHRDRVSEVVVAGGNYATLTPEAIDQVWVRLRAGQAVKPTARELRLSPSTVRTYLLRCGGIRPGPRRRGAGRLRLEEREEISRGLAAGRSYREIATALDRARR